jgi:thioredoxin 1
MASANISNITDESFQSDVLESPTPVLVDLWATWCGPCKAIAPLLESLSADLGDRLKIVKLNIDEHPKTPAAYSVTSIPTLLLFKGGELAGTMVGNPGRKSKIADFVQPHL